MFLLGGPRAGQDWQGRQALPSSQDGEVGMGHGRLGRGMPGGSTAPADGNTAPGRVTGRRAQGDSGGGRSWAAAASGLSPLFSVPQPFSLGSLALRCETQHPPHRK